METKDWIIMLVPIFINAILVFPLHRYINWKVEEKIEKKEKQKKIKNNFEDIVFDLFMKSTHIQRVMGNDPQIILSQNYGDYIRKLFRYYKINSNILHEYAINIKRINDDYFEIENLLANSNDTDEGLMRVERVHALIIDILKELQSMHYKLTG